MFGIVTITVIFQSLEIVVSSSMLLVCVGWTGAWYRGVRCRGVS